MRPDPGNFIMVIMAEIELRIPKTERRPKSEIRKLKPHSPLKPSIIVDAEV